MEKDYGSVSESLRRKAEECVKKRLSEVKSNSDESDILKLNHELQVHQIELEIQNRELIHSKASADDAVEKYTELFDFAPSGYMILTDKGEIADINFSGANMLGKEKLYLKEKLFGFFVSFDTKPIFNTFLEKVFKDKQKVSCDLTLETDSKIPLYVHLIGKVTEKGDQCLVNIVDITRRYLAEEELSRLNGDLEKLVADRTANLEATIKELEAFSYSVSHDFRAPVRHLLGFTEILNDEFHEQLPEKAKHYLEIITGAARQMDVLIEELLSFSKAGRSEMHKSALKMSDAMENALLKVTPLIGDRNIEWNISNLPVVNGDYYLLVKVWVNLLGNAVKFTRNMDKAVISVGFKEENEENVFFIEDNGVGFDMDYSHKLFCVFQKLHSTEQFEGTGIGLANVRRIISRHGGRTWAYAEVDKGATFYFSLPK